MLTATPFAGRMYMAALAGVLCLPSAAFAAEEQTVDSLVRQLQGAGYRERADVASSLGKTGDPNALEPLLRLLDDDLGTVRSSAAAALGLLGESAAVEILIDTLEDPTEQVRIAAALALAAFKDPRTIEPLKRFFREGPAEAVAASRGLQNFKDREMAEFFGGFLGNPEFGPIAAASVLIIGDAAGEMLLKMAVMGKPAKAAAALPLLAQIRGSEAIDTFLAALHHTDGKVRIAAASALKGLDDERIVQKLTDAFGRETVAGKVEIIRILGGIKDESAVGALVLALEDDSAEVRTRAAAALGSIGDSRALGALYDRLADSALVVRNTALSALGRITGENIVFREYLDTKKAFFSHPPYEAGVCTACHDPHTASGDGALKLPAKELCYGCHKEVGSRVLASRHLHEPVEKDECEGCHDSHGSNYPHLLRRYFPDEYYLEFDVENYALCWQCHNRDTVLEEQTETLTAFRNGTRNLHLVHVNRKKGRSCKSCHQPHSADQKKLAPYSRPGVGWKLPVQLTLTDTGGNCVVGCHWEQSYNRVTPVVR